ncbi:hypothetical protein MTYM_01613 [Methylococcales bacterium]|nr:hypothetical protein MTYM_01613 [Methylococcales bacterium]
MILAIFLTLLFLLMALYTAVFVKNHIVRYILFLIYSSAVFFVWNPAITTIIANFFGVGRGLDFTLVMLSVAILNGLLFCARHLNSQHQCITQLARHLAKHEARRAIDRKN